MRYIKKYQYLGILVIVSTGLLLRLINLDQSLWWDEAINVIYAKSTSFWWFVSKYTIGDFHPPGWFAVLWFFGRIFGYSEVAVRFPSVIFGLITIFLTYLIGKELFSKRVGVLAALFLTLAPLHIFYSQEARMYSLSAFAVTCAMYFLIKLTKGSRFSFWGYAFSVFLILYSDYVAYFILPAQVLYILFFQRVYIKKFFASFILGVFTVVPWLLVFPTQLLHGQQMSKVVEGWGQVVGGADIKTAGLLWVKILLGRISVADKLTYAFLIGLLSLPYLGLSLRLIKKIGSVKLLCLWLFLPTIGVFLFSFFIPIFSYFRFIFLLPAFYLLTAYGLSLLPKKYEIIFMVLIVLSEIVFSSIYFINPKFQREDWRGAVSFASQNFNQESLIIFETDEVPAAFKYYMPGYMSGDSGVMGGLKNIPVRTFNDLNDLESLNGKNKVFLFEYLIEVTDPNKLLGQKLKSLGFVNTKSFDFRGVGIIRTYERPKDREF